MSIFIGYDKVKDIYIGEQKVKQIFVGLKQIYTNNLTPTPTPSIDKYIYFDYAESNLIQKINNQNFIYDSDIEWKGNVLTRPNYPNLGYSSLTSADQMELKINGKNYSYSYNAHWATVDAVKIPNAATQLNIEGERSNNGGFSIPFGLISINATNSLDFTTGNGKRMLIQPQDTDLHIYTLNINDDGIQRSGTSIYRIIVNIQNRGDRLYWFHVNKIWFS